MRLLISLLVLALAGCAGAPAREQRILPPVDLIQETQAPSGSLTTNRDLANRVLELREALSQCNLDKKALREWADEP